jgi:hypothetical protein
MIHHAYQYDNAIVREYFVRPRRFRPFAVSAYSRCNSRIPKQPDDVCVIKKVKVFVYGRWFPRRSVRLHGLFKYPKDSRGKWAEYQTMFTTGYDGIIDSDLVIPGPDPPAHDPYQGGDFWEVAHRYTLIDGDYDEEDIPWVYDITMTFSYEYEYLRQENPLVGSTVVYFLRGYRLHIDPSTWSRVDFRRFSLRLTDMVHVDMHNVVFGITTNESGLDRESTIHCALQPTRGQDDERLILDVHSRSEWMDRLDEYNVLYSRCRFFIYFYLGYHQSVDYSADCCEGFELVLSDDPMDHTSDKLKYHRVDNIHRTVKAAPLK